MALKFEEYTDHIKVWLEDGLTHAKIAERIGGGCKTSNVRSIIYKRLSPKFKDRRPGAFAGTIGRTVVRTNKGEITSGNKRNVSTSGIDWLISQFTDDNDPDLRAMMQTAVALEFANLSEDEIQRRTKGMKCSIHDLKTYHTELYNACRLEHVKNVSENYRLNLFRVHEQLSLAAVEVVPHLRELVENPETPPSVREKAIKDILDLTVHNSPVSNQSQKMVDLGKEFGEAVKNMERLLEQKGIVDVLDREPN